MTATLTAPDSTGPLPVVPAASAAGPDWFTAWVHRAAAYGWSARRLRAQQVEAAAAGDHLRAAVFGDAAELRDLYREDDARLVALYWPAGTGGSPSDLHP